MIHLKTINEYISNLNNFDYLIKKMEKEIKNIFPNIQLFTKYVGNINTPKYYEIRTNGILNNELKIMNIFLDKWKNIFNKNGLLLLYKKNSYAEKGQLLNYYDCVIKNSKVQRIKPPKYIYHVASFEKRNFILENGLIPKENTDWTFNLSYEPAVFASINKDNLFLPQDKDIWIIDTENLPNKWYIDLNLNKITGYHHNDFIMTYEPIPIENLKLLEK